ncbi:MAG: hypothetical protein M3Z92_11000 [Bacteroidota bacterium]|nr:hypothetical protein [Bacteroidota bacterium]
MYDGNALRDVLKVVGKRFHDEGIAIKLFIPEDVGHLMGVEGMTTLTLLTLHSGSMLILLQCIVTTSMA